MTKTAIPRQFRGPKKSGNGGYICGLMAGAFDNGSTVTINLKAPPPIDTPLERKDGADFCQLFAGPHLLADATLDQLDLDILPPLPSPEILADAANNLKINQVAFLRECFVCGPERPLGGHEDGALHIYSGSVPNSELHIGSWSNLEQWAGDDGNVDPIYIWSALDCPGYFAAVHPSPALLGRMTGRISRPLPATGTAYVLSWPITGDDRKKVVGTAVYSADGDLIAAAKAVWVLVSDDLFKKMAGEVS